MNEEEELSKAEEVDKYGSRICDAIDAMKIVRHALREEFDGGCQHLRSVDMELEEAIGHLRQAEAELCAAQLIMIENYDTD